MKEYNYIQIQSLPPNDNYLEFYMEFPEYTKAECEKMWLKTM